MWQQGKRFAGWFLMAIGVSAGAVAQAPPPPAPLAPLGAVPVPAANPQSSAKALLGQALFWDEQLSLTGTVACGTCHQPRAGGSDPRVVVDTGSSRFPGADGVLGTADDGVGSAGVPQHGSNGLYAASALFGMQPQVGSRQSPSMINAGHFSQLFWDGRATTRFVDPLSGSELIATGGALENQALGPLVNSLEMAHVGGTLSDMQARIGTVQPLALAEQLPAALAAFINGQRYPALFQAVFGSPEISAQRIAYAMASYQRTLQADQTPLDAELSGTPALTNQERQGLNLFRQNGCAGCHSGALLSDDAFHYIGVRASTTDLGRMAVTGLNANRGQMHTPSLRNVELSPPYMADGRLASLEDVVAFYNRGGDFTAPNKPAAIRPLNLTAPQQAALVAFLRRPLTDPRVTAESGPFERPTLFTESNRVPQISGGARAGSSGLPRLVALEPAITASQRFTIAIENARPAARAIAVLDLDDPAALADPQSNAVFSRAEFSVGSSGSLSGTGSVDVSIPAGTGGLTLKLRVFIEDPLAATGWAMTELATFSVSGDDARVFADGFGD